MVPLGRGLVSSHRLSVQTTLVSGIVWPQFVMQVLTVGWGKGWLVEGEGNGKGVSPSPADYRVWGSVVSSPSGVKTDFFVHFELEQTNLVTTNLIFLSFLLRILRVIFTRIAVPGTRCKDTAEAASSETHCTSIGCTPTVGGRGGRMGSEIGPLSSPGRPTTSYRFPIVTIGLSLTVFAVFRMFQTDRRNWFSKRWP